MRILVISPTPSHPQDAGNRARIHALLATLRDSGHRVHFCFIARESVGNDGIAAMQAAWDTFTLVPHDRRAEAPAGADGHTLDAWFTTDLAERLGRLARDLPPPDVVLVEYVFLSRALEFFPTARLRVLDAHDQFADRHARLRALGLPAGFFSTTQDEEGRGFDRADIVLAIQRDEAAEFEKRTRARVLTLGYWPRGTPRPEAQRIPKVQSRIGWIGSANPINTAALRRFLTHVNVAAIRAADAELVIAGQGGASLGAVNSAFRVLGSVPSSERFLSDLDLFVNPHEGGTGLKVKTVEALALGLPIIGTADSFAGLPAREVFHAAPDAAACAAFVHRWLADDGFRDAVARASVELASRYFDEVAADTVAFLGHLAGTAAPLPRALVVTDVPFWEGRIGNHSRIAGLLRAAQRAFEVDVLVVPPASLPPSLDGAQYVGSKGRFLRPNPLDGSGDPPPAVGSSRLTAFERQNADPAALAALHRTATATRYSAVIVEYIRLSYLLKALPRGTVRVLDTHDLMSLRAETFRRFGREHHIQIGIAEEMEILSRCDAVLAIQHEDAEFLEGVFPNRSLLVPHGVTARWVPPHPGQARKVVFIGGNSPMNRDALSWFAAQVWPAVAQEGAALHVAGGVCESVNTSPNIVLHGEVTDLDAFLCDADLAVNPVFYGGGLKIKTLDYLARGIPTVVTAEAIRGFPAPGGSAWLLASTRDEFVGAVSVLAKSADLRAEVGAAAFAYARTHFDPRTVEAALRVLAEFSRGQM